MRIKRIKWLANKMVSQYFLEDLNRISTEKYKIEEKFELIH